MDMMQHEAMCGSMAYQTNSNKVLQNHVITMIVITGQFPECVFDDGFVQTWAWDATFGLGRRGVNMSMYGGNFALVKMVSVRLELMFTNTAASMSQQNQQNTHYLE